MLYYKAKNQYKATKGNAFVPKGTKFLKPCDVPIFPD